MGLSEISCVVGWLAIMFSEVFCVFLVTLCDSIVPFMLHLTGGKCWLSNQHMRSPMNNFRKKDLKLVTSNFWTLTFEIKKNSILRIRSIEAIFFLRNLASNTSHVYIFAYLPRKYKWQFLIFFLWWTDVRPQNNRE